MICFFRLLQIQNKTCGGFFFFPTDITVLSNQILIPPDMYMEFFFLSTANVDTGLCMVVTKK